MENIKYKQKREERRLRSLARIVLAGCISIACMMLGTLSIKLFSDGLFFRSVKNVSAEVEEIKVNIPELTTNMTESLFLAGFDLFKNSIQKEESILIMPYTTLMALGILENGAQGETLAEIQSYLGGHTISEMNSGYAALNKKLEGYSDIKCITKNSIWLTRFETFKPRDYFLKVNATYYDADLFVADFSKGNTLNKMNEWVKVNTEGKVEVPIQSIEDEAAMYILSSFNFNANWAKPYERSDILGGEFKLTNGKKKNVEYMYSKEYYLEDDKAEGFVKAYTDNGCSFVVIRPKEGSLYDYIKTLDSEGFKKILRSKKTQKAIVAIPKFTYETQTDLSSSLKILGIEAAFDREKADFGKIFDEEQQAYLGRIVQKNYIQIDEIGMSSSGAIAAEVNATTSAEEDIQKSIIFNTPFLYAVIDNKTKLPILIGSFEG